MDIKIVIFSDYNKGLFSKEENLINDIIKRTKISIVDPKCGDLNKWKGCTIFKPNLQEALSLSGCSNLIEAGKKILETLNCKAVVVTKSENGVTVFQEEGIFEI